MKNLLLISFALVVLGCFLLSVVVEVETKARKEQLVRGNGKKALIIFHPSWVDGFQEELTSALAEGLKEKGWAVDRQTANSGQLPEVRAYDLVVFGTNTYYWRPDLPTKHVLGKINLQDKPCAGIVTGAGSTGRAERILREAITRANGRVLDVRPFWLWRPNDESRMSEPNRTVAIDLAKNFGKALADQVLH